MRGFIYKFLILILFVFFGFGFRVSDVLAVVNINTAGVTELDTLDGIGPAYAQRIIDYRNSNGLFKTIEEIKNVSGIGDATFDKIKNDITVGTVSSDVTVTSSQSSVHYSAEPVSEAEEIEPEFILSAGRDRIGVVGSPIEFRVETNYSYSRQNIFSWNFGDGTQGGGPVLNHVYEYPGEYVVVLSASIKGTEVVSRVNVKITDPKLSVRSATPERIEIANGSEYEVNLFGRELAVGSKVFAFPKDTIIKSKQSIFFSSKVTGLLPANVHEVLILVKRNKTEQIEFIQNQIASLRQQVANVSEPPYLAIQQSSEVREEEVELVEIQTATVVKSGWFETFKRFFLRTR